MKKAIPAFLEYAFIFDTTETWQHLFQFEQDLSKFFALHGCEAQILKTIEGGGSKRILYIKRIDKLLQPAVKKNMPVRSPNEQLSKMRKVIRRQ